MARNTLIGYSLNNNIDHFFNISDENGAQVGGSLPATFAGGETRKYTVDVPAALPTGYYTFSMHRDSNNALRAQGEFWWDNADQCLLSSGEYNYLVNSNARFDQLDAAQALLQQDTTTIIAELTAAVTARDAILAAITGLTIPTLTQITTGVESALLDDTDGQAFRESFAATIEAALANEADGNATIAAFQGAVTAALTNYDAAAVSDLTTAETNLTTLLNGLNNLSAADIAAEINNYDAATGSELTQAVTDILSQSGLTPVQEVVLTRVLNLLEADEAYTATGGTGTVQKLLKGTNTVLFTKDVTTSTPCDIATTITEQP